MTAVAITIRQIEDVAEIDGLEPLWLDLHRHHREVSTFRHLVVDDDASWHRRRALYRLWFAEGSAIILLAVEGAKPVGYVVARIHRGLDDTFAVSDRHAEIYTLSVAQDARSRGIGTQLMDAMERRLEDLGIVDLVIAVMYGNDAAIRFYRRRGLEPAELYLRRTGNHAARDAAPA
jgi:ribosomal protein S18 acetylase RimI-like enzyme